MYLPKAPKAERICGAEQNDVHLCRRRFLSRDEIGFENEPYLFHDPEDHHPTLATVGIISLLRAYASSCLSLCKTNKLLSRRDTCIGSYE